MPTHYGHTPGTFNADTIRLLASPGGAAKATGRTGTPAFGNAAVGRTLLNSATSRARQAGGAARRGTGTTDLSAGRDPFAGRTLLSGSAGGTPNPRQASDDRNPNDPNIAPPHAVFNPANGYWEVQSGNATKVYTEAPIGQGGGGGQATAPAPFQFNTALGSGAPAPEPFQFDTPDPGTVTASAPDVPQLGRITPYRSTAPDPGSPAMLARPEAPNVDPLTLPEARQRTVANRSQDLGHLQSARSRRSVRGPRGSFNMADTARRTLLGSL